MSPRHLPVFEQKELSQNQIVKVLTFNDSVDKIFLFTVSEYEKYFIGDRSISYPPDEQFYDKSGKYKFFKFRVTCNEKWTLVIEPKDYTLSIDEVVVKWDVL